MDVDLELVDEETDLGLLVVEVVLLSETDLELTLDPEVELGLPDVVVLEVDDVDYQ